MYLLDIIDRITITPKAEKLLLQLFEENKHFANLIREAQNPEEANLKVYAWVSEWMKAGHSGALEFYKYKTKGRKSYHDLSWREVGAIRLLDYIDNAGRVFENLNKTIKQSISDPIHLIWMAYHKGKGGAKPEFFMDMIHLMRQFSGSEKRIKPTKKKVLKWMERHPSGLEAEIIEIREENRDRILKVIIKNIESGLVKSSSYNFEEGSTEEQKLEIARKWWNNYKFHLKFAIRSPELLNEMLDYSLDPDTMALLTEAKDAGIPFFINPYYLSLLNVNAPVKYRSADLAIRDYVIYSKELIKEFGSIVAWEKEDKVETGKPNAAGWLLPNDCNIHRRYPEVAILIPDTAGRACGGLCVSCQRMYDFQKGRLNFNIDKLLPKESWSDKLQWLMKYFESDSQLRDILITGGDALMNSDKSLKEILDAVYDMSVRKIAYNKQRPVGEKHAEMQRVRLGTRLPVYIPQRITDSLIDILVEFKDKASKIGIKQFVVQTHFISPMEITPVVCASIKKLNSAGWTVANQMVFTAAASRRGYANKLRQVLNDCGVLSYYTFSVKGFMENHHNFATNERAIQEQVEEKILGRVPRSESEAIHSIPLDAQHTIEQINAIRKRNDIPFLGTDKNIMNLPGVGKSLSFRTVGITRRGRRILEFEHDKNRNHSPIINKMGRVNIIESKPVLRYLNQMESIGEDPDDYKDVWGYSIGETEKRSPMYEYPEYNYIPTSTMTNLELKE
ncbi:MAG: KamA family protein [Bacteroidales bacterium]|nr:KamA family protein [Bacteroidales bacterium]